MPFLVGCAYGWSSHCTPCSSRISSIISFSVGVSFIFLLVATSGLTSRRSQPPLRLSVPLSRFTSQVGGGSAFFVRHWVINQMDGLQNYLQQWPRHHNTLETRSEERRVGKECRSRWSP